MTDPTYAAAFALITLLLAAMVVARLRDRKARRADDERERRRRMRASIDRFLEADYRAALRDEAQA